MPMEALYVIGVLILVGGFAYGIYQSRTRNRANDGVREEATRQLYDDPDAYEHGGKQKLDNQLRPEK